MTYSPAPTPVDGSVLEAIPWEPGSESLRAGDSGAVLVSEGGVLRHTRAAHQHRPRVLRLVCGHASGAQVEDVRALWAETVYGAVPITYTHPDDVGGAARVWWLRVPVFSVERVVGGVQASVEVMLEKIARPIPVLAASGGAVPPTGGGLPGEGGDTPPDGTPGGVIPVNVDGVGLHDMAPVEP